jgi:beta-lactamase regulating signal transducer with metallopeptidase domain
MMSYFWNVVTSHSGFEFLTLLALATAKATLLLTFAAFLCFAFRRFSAATRHLVWASALCASLLLPFLSFIKMWEVPILPAQMLVLDAPSQKESPAGVEAYEMPQARVPNGLSTAPGASAEAQKFSALPAATDSAGELAPAPHTPALPATPQPRAASLAPQLLNFALAAWLAGMLLVLFKLLAGFIATGFLTRRAVAVADPALVELFSSLLVEVNLKSRVRLLRSEHTSMPMVYGILRPAVLLPAEADAWSEERRRMVLLHELTHITRRDCLTQMLAQLACAFYWFNPLIWRAARWLRVEREQACDDYVLSIGTKPSDYANHLLDIARATHERSMFDWSQTTSVAMARRSQLEGRLLAILSKDNKRGAVSRAVVTGLVAFTCLLLFSLAAIHPTVIRAQNPRNSDAASSVENDALNAGMPDTHAAVAAAREDDATIQGTRDEAGGKQEIATAAVDSLPQLISNKDRMEQEDAPGIKEETERSAAQEAAGVVAQISPADQPTEAEPASNREANSFIKVGQQQQQPERSVQSQDRPLDFIDGMASVGYTNLSVDELIRLKTARVTPEYVRGLRALGFANLTSKELASMSIHGVTPAYIQSLRGAGYHDLSAKELTSFRIYGITPEYIRTLRDAGHGSLTAKQLRDFKIYGVTPAFIGGVSAAGYSNLSPKEIVSLRIYGITPEFIRKARSRLGDLTIRQLISLKTMNILEEDKGKDKSKD